MSRPRNQLSDRLRSWSFSVSILLILLPATVHGQQSQPYYVRNHNPFLQIFGVPAPEGGRVTAPGAFESRFSLKVANHADAGRKANEEITLDGESYYADVVLRYGLGERWGVGIDLPFVMHHDGVLDNLIEDWHSTLGLSNSKREGVSNHLAFVYQRDGVAEIDFTESSRGIGDVRLVAAYQLMQDDVTGRSVALRGLVKLPTGDADELRGSGAADVAASIEASGVTTLGGYAFDVFGQLGVLLAGDGDVLGDQQENVVSFASAGLVWHWTDNIDIQVQAAFQDAYFDSALKELGGNTADLTIGTNFRLPRLGLQVNVGFIEDLVSDATPDFAVFISIKRGTRTMM